MTEPQLPYLDYPEHWDDRQYPGYAWGPVQHPAPGPSWVEITVRIVGGSLGLCAGGLWLLMAFAVLSSLYSTDPASDPHGYGVVFGVLIGVPSGIVAAFLLPLAFPGGRRLLGYVVVVPSFIVLLGLQFLAMYLS